MSIVLNYSMAGSKATIASVTIDGVRFFATGCDSRREQGIIELDTDSAITPSSIVSSPTRLVLPEINGYGGAVWKHFGSYQLAAGDDHYFEIDTGPKTYTRIVSLSDIGLKARTVDEDGSALGDERSGRGPGDNGFEFNVNSLYGSPWLFRVQGQNATTEGTYMILVQSIGNHWDDEAEAEIERPPQDVGNTRSRALDIPFPPVLFDDYSLGYGSPPFYLTEGDKDYFVIDVPQKVLLQARIASSENAIVNPSIKLVRSNRRIAASDSYEISRTIDAGKYWIKIEGDPPAGQEESRYSFYYTAFPVFE